MASAAVFLLALSAQAQEDLPVLEIQDPTHSELNLDEDKTLIYDHPSHTSIVKDSVQRVVPSHNTKMAKPEPNKGSRKDRDEDETLSFNFLYYMFQKFKMSDLIDQQ